MYPVNDGVFYLSESATHQEEYFLKHDKYYTFNAQHNDYRITFVFLHHCLE